MQGASAGGNLFPRADNVLSAESVDETDRVLIEYLLQDGKMTNRVLATHTGISESAVSIRLRKLAASGAIIFTLSSIGKWLASTGSSSHASRPRPARLATSPSTSADLNSARLWRCA